MAYGTVNADVIGTSVAGSNIGAGNASIMKNRLINSDMRIDQRNAGASVTGNDGVYTLDRWLCQTSASSKFTVQQNAGSITSPIGFTKYLGCTSSSSYSVSSTDFFNIGQPIEGFNWADLNWGTANAKTITVSAWVYSSLTGTFGGVLNNGAQNRSYPFLYTISSANTWTQISVTIAGDTTGTWTTDNSRSAWLKFSLGTGSTRQGTAGSWSSTLYFGATGETSVVGTSGATFYITGVQLEVGEQATGFEYRIYGTELQNCQRYYNRPFPYQVSLPIGLMNQGAFSVILTLNPPMRTLPSLDQVAGSLWRFNGYTAGENFANTWTIGSSQSSGQAIYLNASAVLTSGNGYAVTARAYDTTNYLGFSAEL